MAFKEAIKLKGNKHRALTQEDWYAYKKKRPQNPPFSRRGNTM